MSEPDAGLPAWLELAWEQPIQLGSVVLVFDTGMHRPLTLSHSDGFLARMVWGQPQPETVRDYHLEGRSNGEWRTLVEVTGNYQRRQVHPIALPSGMAIDALRVTVTASNGLDHARLCEVRAYESNQPIWSTGSSQVRKNL